jgi:phosphomannomutase
MRSIIIFDIDGTLTLPAKPIEPYMLELLETLSENYDIALATSSQLPKIQTQVTPMILNLKHIQYIFSQNGMVTYKNGELISELSIKQRYTEEQLQNLINFCLRYIADLTLPFKRGAFIDFRTSMIVISVIGQNCSIEERVQFIEYEKKHQIRKKFIQALKYEFKEYDLDFTIGGQVSFEILPRGWDKTYCLNHIKNEYETIWFFGDRTDEGGNDHHIYQSPLTKSYKVTSPDETLQICRQLFMN